MKTNCTLSFKRFFFSMLIIVAGMQFSQAQTVISSANVAVNRPATSSSVQMNHYPQDAFDGNAGTRFSSIYNDDEWLSVDLGQVFLLSQVTITWERAYAKDYNILFSRNGTFTDLNQDSIQIRNNVLGPDSIAGVNTITAKPNTIARYVKMQGVHRATVFGYSIYEMQIAGSISSSNLLPVTLTGFTASEQGSSTLLEWMTTTENNTAGFSIERSTDGTNFSAIGWVDGLNGGTVTSHYSYIDKQSSNGKNYYRLKVADLSGKTGATPVVSINAADVSRLRVYPIPAQDHISIQYKGTAGEKLGISITNVAGQPIYSTSMLVKGSQQTVIINRTPGMLPGLYMLTIASAGKAPYTTPVVLE